MSPSRPVLAVTPAVAALAAVAAGVLQPDFVDASGPDSTAASLAPGLAWLTANPDAGWAASLLSALALALLASWAYWLGRVPSGRGGRLGRIGGTLSGIALLCAAGANIAIGTVRLALTQPQLGGAAAADAYAGIVTGSALGALFLPALLLGVVGGVLLLIALVRSAEVPWWAAVPAGLLIAAFNVLPLGRIGVAVVILVLAAPVAIVLLRSRTRSAAPVAQLDPTAA